MALLTQWMSLSKLRDSEGQGGLVCCSPWGRKELETSGRLTTKPLIDNWVSFL